MIKARLFLAFFLHLATISQPMSIRDANVVIIETGRTVVRAGIGLHDLLKTPTVVRIQLIHPVNLIEKT